MFWFVPLPFICDNCMGYLVRSRHNSYRKRWGPLPQTLQRGSPRGRLVSALLFATHITPHLTRRLNTDSLAFGDINNTLKHREKRSACSARDLVYESQCVAYNISPRAMAAAPSPPICLHRSGRIFRRLCRRRPACRQARRAKPSPFPPRMRRRLFLPRRQECLSPRQDGISHW